jgi:hypothetical protein
MAKEFATRFIPEKSKLTNEKSSIDAFQGLILSWITKKALITFSGE